MDGQYRQVIRQKLVDTLAEPIPAFTRRDLKPPGVAGKALAVVGMRRSGKTTYLWQLLSGRLARGAPRETLVYFSFEDERLAGMSAVGLGLLLEEYYRLHPESRDRQRVMFLLDEIQVVPGWESFVRRILDTERIDVCVSGSSARLLSREVATSMRGRAMELLVTPFSFREYLRHLGHEPDRDPQGLPKAARSRLQKDLREYLVAGGFPETLGITPRDRFELLRGYVDVVLLRDVVERHAVSQPLALRWMVRQLLGNAAGAFSIHKFHNDLRAQGIPVAKDTLHAFLGHLSDAFLLRTVSVASGSERRRMVNPRKVYPIDPGLIPVFDRTGRANTGHALETCVLQELERRGAEVSYVRTEHGFEVDFLAHNTDGSADLIQVCSEATDAAVCEREVRALREAAGEHRGARMHLVTLDAQVPMEVPRSIAVHDAADWLLTDSPRVRSVKGR